jgi:rod shape-determining protein MreC
MSRFKKRFIIFFILTGVAFFLMTLQHSGKEGSLFAFLSYPFNALNDASSVLISKFNERRNLLEENRRIKKELGTFIAERQRYGEALQENIRLREIVGLKEQRRDYVTSARVISRGYDTMINTVIMDKGLTGGVQKDMVIITPLGLVGKVYSVSKEYSTGLLLKDPNFSVAVRLQNNRREGVVSGTGYSYCLLKYIPPEETVETGDVVVTSGLDGLFPPGLPVGIVSSVKKEGVELFQEIKVAPFQSDAKIEEVLILKK